MGSVLKKCPPRLGRHIIFIMCLHLLLLKAFPTGRCLMCSFCSVMGTGEAAVLIKACKDLCQMQASATSVCELTWACHSHFWVYGLFFWMHVGSWGKRPKLQVVGTEKAWGKRRKGCAWKVLMLWFSLYVMRDVCLKANRTQYKPLSLCFHTLCYV